MIMDSRLILQRWLPKDGDLRICTRLLTLATEVKRMPNDAFVLP
jgi:hypothetical protein